jgi:hypothetical protein
MGNLGNAREKTALTTFRVVVKEEGMSREIS